MATLVTDVGSAKRTATAPVWQRATIFAGPIAPPHVEVLMPTFHITVRGADREAMADLGRVHGGRGLPPTPNEEGPEPRVPALADEPTIRRLTDAGYRVEQHEDVDQA